MNSPREILDLQCIYCFYFRMFEKYPQGRLKVIQSSQSCLEWILTWPKSENHSNEDARLVLNMAIVWHYLDSNQSEVKNWTMENIKEAIPKWLDITTNFTVNSKVKRHSLGFLGGLLEYLWKTNLQIKIIRSFERVFYKAALDIESAKLAGFLKISVISTTIRPEILSFNGTTRKIPASHFMCSIFLVIRSKATSDDVTNFYTMKSHFENQVRYLLLTVIYGVKKVEMKF